MIRPLIFFILSVLSLVGKAQTFPSGFPTQFNNGWEKWGYQQSTLGTIVALRDSNWLPRFSGTMIFRPQDIRPYFYDSTELRWYKIWSETDTLTNLATRYDLSLKLNTVDTTNKWVQDIYVRSDSLFKFKNGSESFIDRFNENISNTSLIANGNYSQNWSENQWFVDSIAGQFLFRMGGVGNTGTRRKEFRINWGGSAFGDQMDAYNIMATIKKADLSADSLRLGLISGGTGVLSMGFYDVATPANNTFISYSSTLGLINIQAKDSIWIKGATPAATADSLLAVVYRNPTASRIVKIPLSAAGGGATLNNIGTGFAWAATPAGDIKRVANGTGIVWDSTSTASSLTAKVDTSVIATQYDLTQVVGSQNIQQVLNVGDTSNRPIVYNYNTDTSDDRYTMRSIPSNFEVSYGANGTAMGFTSGWGRFNDVNPSGRPNIVYNWLSYNTPNGGGRINSNEASFRFAAETNFDLGSGPSFEFHIPEIFTKSGVGLRPLSLYIDKTTGATQYNMFATGGVDYKTIAGEDIFSFNVNGSFGFVGRGSNATLTLYDESIVGARYQLQVDGTDVFHNSFGNMQRFDGQIYSNQTTNNPSIYLDDSRTTNNTAGIFINQNSPNAKRPIFITGAVTNGSEIFVENTTGYSIMTLNSAQEASYRAITTNPSDPAGSGVNLAFNYLSAGNNAAVGYLFSNYGNSNIGDLDESAIGINANSLPVTFSNSWTEKARLSTGGAWLINRKTAIGTEKLSINGRVNVNKDSVTYRTTTGTRHMLVIDTTTGEFERMDVPSAGGTTLYTGDDTIAGNRDVNVNNLNLTFSDANTFRVNYDMFVQSKANATIPYTSVIGLTAGNYWQFGHTPSAGSFTRGSGIVVDTLNNVGLGDLTQTTMPLYNTGNSTYIASGLQSRQGNFYGVTTKSATGSISLSEYFILIDASSGNITLTLPAASTAFGANMGIQYVFKRIDNSGNTVSIARAGSDTIDGATSVGLTTQYEVKEIQALSTSTWGIK